MTTFIRAIVRLLVFGRYGEGRILRHDVVLIGVPIAGGSEVNLVPKLGDV
jgi:hypothetical protein